MSETGYVYTLNDPRTGEPKYVGKTVNPSQRLHGHTIDSPNIDVQRWKDNLRENGLEPEMYIVKITALSDLATEEKELIHRLSSEWDLLNKHYTETKESKGNLIRVSTENYKRLNGMKDQGETFDDQITKLLEENDE